MIPANLTHYIETEIIPRYEKFDKAHNLSHVQDVYKRQLIQLGIIEMRERYKSLSREIIVPFEVDMELKDVVLTIPQRGDKKKQLDPSILNVKPYKACLLYTSRCV